MTPSLVVSPIVMRINRTWDVKCPPKKKYVVGGKLVPTVKGLGGRFMQKSRRLAIEIHGPEKLDNVIVTGKNSPKKGSGNKTRTSLFGGGRGGGGRGGGGAPGRGLTRTSHTAETAHSLIDLSQELQDDDRVILRILKERKTSVWGGGGGPFSRGSGGDDSSSSSDEDDDDNSSASSVELEIEDGWLEYRKYGLDEIEDDELDISNPKHPTWEATLGLGRHRERREIKFESVEQAQDFAKELEKLRALTKDRAAQRLEAYQKAQGIMAGVKTVDGAVVISRSDGGGGGAKGLVAGSSDQALASAMNILVEIVSATDLPIADRKSTDPYVVVYLGKQKVHKTNHIPQNLNPIWTVDTGSLFMLSQSAEEFFSAGYGLTFIVKDYDSVTSNGNLCECSISATDLLKQTGDRISFELQLLEKGGRASTSAFKPKLNLRIRKATAEDVKFMAELQVLQKKTRKSNKLTGVYADASFLAPKPEKVHLLKKEKKVIDGVKHYRVKPRPDPTRNEHDTKWMTAKQLDEESMKPTYKWLEAGTGKLGKLYLEVIKCENLPNMDNTVEGLTDAFCCLIYEDAIVNTDVINDELSPRWMPWSQRGFVFNMAHPSSQLLVGVLDYDSDASVNNHDAIGRISIDVTNFRADTEYLLTYDLYRSVLDDVRKIYGTITVRLRLEYPSYRDFVKGSITLPDLNYINLAKRNDFLTSFFVCNGEENLQKLDMGAITAYKNELTGYLDIFYYISQSIITIVLWRGHFDIGGGVLLPVHSMIAFLMGIFVVENFNLIPSFGLFCIAWLLLATNEQRQRNPSPWHITMTFRQMWYAVLTNKAPPNAIADHENEAAIRKYEEANKLRQEKEKKKAQEAAENAKKLSAFLGAENNSTSEAVDADLSTKASGPSIIPNIAAMILLPIQKILGQVCKSLRIISSIVMWDESIYAFILVNACLVLGVVFFFVPWSFFIRWILRIIVWLFLGPWMKLVDIFYVQKMVDGEESETEAFKRLAEMKAKQVGMARDAIMLQKEEILKTRAMKMYMFGRFVTRVPQFKEYRFADVPRHESSATPLKTKPQPVKIFKKSHGQTLVGNMIPTWGGAIDAEKVETAQEKKKEE